jgi:hypothetical protein
MNEQEAPALPRYPKVTKTLRPHQPGTLKLVRRYGDALLCVRYREDARGRQRCTTVELVIDEGPVQRRITGRSLVQVSLPFDDEETRHRAKALGARWDNVHRRWLMSLKMARALGLKARALR